MAKIEFKERYVHNGCSKCKNKHLCESQLENGKVALEAVESFYKMLQGDKGEHCLILAHHPRLDAGTAFSIIYYLQEHLGVFPDTYEKCHECEELYDSDDGGYVPIFDGEGKEVGGNGYCGGCYPWHAVSHDE